MELSERVPILNIQRVLAKQQNKINRKTASHQGKTTKGSDMEPSFVLTVNQGNANKSYNDVIFHLSDGHIYRLASSGCGEVGLLFYAEAQHRVPPGRMTSCMVVKDQKF